MILHELRAASFRPVVSILIARHARNHAYSIRGVPQGLWKFKKHFAFSQLVHPPKILLHNAISKTSQWKMTHQYKMSNRVEADVA